MKKLISAIAIAVTVLVVIFLAINIKQQQKYNLQERYIPLEVRYEVLSRVERFWDIQAPEDYQGFAMVRFDGTKTWMPTGNPINSVVEVAEAGQIPAELDKLIPAEMPELLKIRWTVSPVFSNTGNCTTYIGYIQEGFRLGTEENAPECFQGAEKIEVVYYLDYENCTFEQFSGKHLLCRLDNIEMTITDDEIGFVVEDPVRSEDFRLIREVLEFEGLSSDLPLVIQPGVFYRLTIP